MFNNRANKSQGFINSKAFKNFILFWQRFDKHDVAGVSAKAAYYLLLSFFPLVLLLFSIIADSGEKISEFIIPPSVAILLQDVSPSQTALKITSLAIIIWSASTSIWALMTGIYTAYTGSHKIKPVQGRIRALFYTLILIVAIFFCISLTFLSGTGFRQLSKIRITTSLERAHFFCQIFFI